MRTFFLSNIKYTCRERGLFNGHARSSRRAQECSIPVNRFAKHNYLVAQTHFLDKAGPSLPEFSQQSTCRQQTPQCHHLHARQDRRWGKQHNASAKLVVTVKNSITPNTHALLGGIATPLDKRDQTRQATFHPLLCKGDNENGAMSAFHLHLASGRCVRLYSTVDLHLEHGTRRTTKQLPSTIVRGLPSIYRFIFCD